MKVYFVEQYLYKLKCINLCLRESGSRSSNDWHLPLETKDWHLLLEASSVVSKTDIQLSNPPQESGSPPRLEGTYGCIDLVEIHPSFGPLNKLFVFELEGRYQLHNESIEGVISSLSLSLALLFPIGNWYIHNFWKNKEIELVGERRN